MSRDIAKEKLGVIKQELTMVQSSMDKYDDTNFKIRGWEVTIWSALMVVYFQSGKHTVLLIAIIIPLLFLVLDGMYKSFRESYRNRRTQIHAYLSSPRFERDMRSGKITFFSPIHPTYSYRDILRETFRPHVLPLHAVISILSVGMYVMLA